MSDLFKLNLKDVSGAVISGVIVAVLGYIGSSADVFTLDWNQVLNVAVLAAVSSLLKALGTNGEGKFLGGIKIK